MLAKYRGPKLCTVNADTTNTTCPMSHLIVSPPELYNGRTHYVITSSDGIMLKSM